MAERNVTAKRQRASGNTRCPDEPRVMTRPRAMYPDGNCRGRKRQREFSPLDGENLEKAKREEEATDSGIAIAVVARAVRSVCARARAR